MAKIKLVVHTKTGKKLTYYPSSWDTESQALTWWMHALNGREEVVAFGRFTMAVADIDFVESK